ncbi:hypothetical protein GGI43DRAFT_382181 [Trichoderma evansii]
MSLIQTSILISTRQDSAKLLIDLEALELTSRLLQNEILRLDRLIAWEKLLIEWGQETKSNPESELERITNVDAADPPIGDDTPAASSSPQDTTILGYPTTTEQMQNYWRMVGFSANEPFSIRNYYILEKEVATMLQPKGDQETWLLLDANNHNFVYTGASAYHRQGLVSTTKGGAKLVRAMVISKVVTDFEYRRHRLATHFLKLLAEQIDSREGEEHIAFSVLYSGPKTELFRNCG